MYTSTTDNAIVTVCLLLSLALLTAGVVLLSREERPLHRLRRQYRAMRHSGVYRLSDVMRQAEQALSEATRQE